MRESSPGMLALADSLKRKARHLLAENRLEEAMQALASTLRHAPKDAEAHRLLGDCYLAAEDFTAAYYLYAQARALGEKSAELERRLALARAERGRLQPQADEPVPTEPAAVAALLQRLTGRPTPVTETELTRAASLLHAILYSPSPAEVIARRLNEIDTLMPALLELNIRQARADGRADLAEGLQALFENIQLQMLAEPATGAESSPEQRVMGATPTTPRPRLLVIDSPEARVLELSAEALQSQGFSVQISDHVPPGSPAEVVIFRLAPADGPLLTQLRACKLAGAKLIAYAEAAPQHQALADAEREHAYFTALHLADRVVVPSRALAASLENAVLIPPGWSRRNPLWEAPVPARETLNLGWAAAAGEVDELAEVRRAVIRILREFPHTRLVTIGDHRAQHLFNALPEERRQFIPLVSADEFPYLLGQLDVLLVPLRDTDFNRAQSDERLMQAGARRVPWVASPIPAHLAWGVGGLIAAERDEWYLQLRKLVTSPEVRATLALVGRQRAEEREMTRLSMAWVELIEAVGRPAPPAPAREAWPVATPSPFARQLEALAR